MRVVKFPKRLDLAQKPTPLQYLERLSTHLGGPRIWVKRDDLTGCAVSGNKIRKLEFTLADAIDKGCNTILTCGGVQSNHCRTTALLCAQLGLNCHLLLRGSDSEIADGNLLLDKLAGAKVTCYPQTEYQAREKEIFIEWEQFYRDEGKTPYCIPVGASDGTGVWGYIACAEELANDFISHSIHPGHILSATGSGGTQAGLTAGNVLFGLNAKVWGINVCDDEQYFLNKVHHDLQQWKDWFGQELNIDSLSINVIDGYVGPGYAKATPAMFETIKALASLEGLILDPVYTGKAFHGMIDQYRQGRFDDSQDIVFVHTGGIFGLFPQRDQIHL